jgi:hypothetical protein
MVLAQPELEIADFRKLPYFSAEITLYSFLSPLSISAARRRRTRTPRIYNKPPGKPLCLGAPSPGDKNSHSLRDIFQEDLKIQSHLDYNLSEIFYMSRNIFFKANGDINEFR